MKPGNKRQQVPLVVSLHWRYLHHNVKRQLQDNALSKRITKETYSQFCARVNSTLLNYSPEIIDRTIESMDRRIDMVIKSKGQRIKY